MHLPHVRPTPSPLRRPALASSCPLGCFPSCLHCRSYDFTHCIQDSLEHIDFSICTLEFETRRESYYWLLDALGLFKPMVFEMSRLNIEYVVLSKRKLIKLVDTGRVRGWDDPRMPTIKGFRRRGFTASMLNNFCNSIGVTRNENLIEYSRLEEVHAADNWGAGRGE